MVRLSFAGLAMLALLPAASGIGGCAPSCDVTSHGLLGFLAPVTYVESGNAVTWRTLDGFHTASEHELCFNVTMLNGSPGTAVFLVDAGRLYASTVGEEDESFHACTTAQALPDGSFAVDYVCFLHPNTMNGTIVVK